MAESLSVATTAVSSEKVVVVDSGEVGRSAVYSRYDKNEIISGRVVLYAVCVL
jgi:hypothetical protein